MWKTAMAGSDAMMIKCKNVTHLLKLKVVTMPKTNFDRPTASPYDF